MRRRLLVIAGLLLLLFVGLLLYGVRLGDAGFVLDNAQGICYT